MYFAEDAKNSRKHSDLDESTILGSLPLQCDMFYGRTAEMAMLLDLIECVVSFSNQPLMATIAGCPGAG